MCKNTMTSFKSWMNCTKNGEYYFSSALLLIFNIYHFNIYCICKTLACPFVCVGENNGC